MKINKFIFVGIFAFLLIFGFILGQDAPKKEEVETPEEKDIEITVLEKPDSCSQLSQEGDLISVHYTGKFADGKVFDTSVQRGQPLQFKLGSGGVIKGFERGLVGMCVNERRSIFVPSHLAYGEKGIPGRIPPHSDLIFELDLLEITRPSILDSIPGFLSAASPVLLILFGGYYFFQRIRDTESSSKSSKKKKKN